MTCMTAAVVLGPMYLAAPGGWLFPVVTSILTAALTVRNVAADGYEAFQRFLPFPPFVLPHDFTREGLRPFSTGEQAVRWLASLKLETVAACRESMLARYAGFADAALRIICDACEVVATGMSSLPFGVLPDVRNRLTVLSSAYEPSMLCASAFVVVVAGVALRHGFLEAKARAGTPLRHVDVPAVPAIVTRLADAASESLMFLIVANPRTLNVAWKASMAAVGSVLMVAPSIALFCVLTAFYMKRRRRNNNALMIWIVSGGFFGLVHVARYLSPIAYWIVGRVGTWQWVANISSSSEKLAPVLYPDHTEIAPQAAWVEMSWTSLILITTLLLRNDEVRTARMAGGVAAYAGRSLTHAVVNPNHYAYTPPPCTAVRTSALLTAAIAVGSLAAVLLTPTPAKAAVAYFGLTFGVSMLSYVGQRAYHFIAGIGVKRQKKSKTD